MRLSGPPTHRCGLHRKRHNFRQEELNSVKRTKFDYVIASPSPEIATEVRFCKVEGQPSGRPAAKLLL